jgi:hypothetical protein
MDDDQLPVERLLELAVFAPIGLALILHDRVPGELRRRRQALENRVQLARMIGQFAVQQGRAEMARQVKSRTTHGRTPSEPEPTPTDVTQHVGRHADDESSSGAMSHSSVPALVLATADEPSTSAEALPIAGYEALAAMHVVQRLGSLRPDELEVVRQFETSHRARRTVLAKVEQLQAHR